MQNQLRKSSTQISSLLYSVLCLFDVHPDSIDTMYGAGHIYKCRYCGTKRNSWEMV